MNQAGSICYTEDHITQICLYSYHFADVLKCRIYLFPVNMKVLFHDGIRFIALMEQDIFNALILINV